MFLGLAYCDIAPMLPEGIGVVIPFFNGLTSVKQVVCRSAETLESFGIPYLICVVDDSADSLRGAALGTLLADIPHVRLLHNASNLGQHAATLAGLRALPMGWTAVTMDEDLRFDPEVVLEAAIAPRTRCVYVVDAKADLMIRMRRLVVWMALRTVTTQVPRITSSYRILSPDIVQRLIEPDDRPVQLEAMIAKVGPDYSLVLARSNAEMRPSGYGAWQLFALLWRIVVGHSSLRNALGLTKIR